MFDLIFLSYFFQNSDISSQIYFEVLKGFFVSDSKKYQHIQRSKWFEQVMSSRRVSVWTSTVEFTVKVQVQVASLLSGWNGEAVTVLSYSPNDDHINSNNSSLQHKRFKQQKGL